MIKNIFVQVSIDCIICPEHGEFWQLPYKHLSGRGCFRCGVLKIKEKLKYTSKEKDFKYKDLDFFFEKEIKPDYYFVNAKKRFNKEDNIENEEVCKIYDCGYFQYKWTK